YLEISTDLSTAGRCTFDYASYRSRYWRVSARTRSKTFRSVVDLRRVDRRLEWLDHLLGRNRLVRCARCVRLAAMGVVEFGTGARSTTNSPATSFAGAIRSPICHRECPRHPASV